MPDIAAVVVRELNTVGTPTLAAYSMIAVIGDGAGAWHRDANGAWLGLADHYF